MYRRTLLLSFPCLIASSLVSSPARAHSPWGQYAVYRQKHLLVLSTRDDVDTYPYSKLLVDAINHTEPTAKARPARAKNLKRAYDLLRTDQFQFALLSGENVYAMRTATGAFEGGEQIDLKSIYQFGQMEFVVRADFPDKLVAIVTHAVLTNLETLPGAVETQQVLSIDTLHPGAQEAVLEYRSRKPAQ